MGYASYPFVSGSGGGGGGSGTVTSVDVSGGSTGLTTTGGPVMTSGVITIGGTLAVASGGTGVTTSTGTGSVVLNTSPTLVTPALGTPASGVATHITGLPLTTGVTGALPIANGGTANTTAAAAFAALAPLTTAGDIIIENNSPTPARLAIGSTGNVLTVSAGLPAWAPPATSGTVTSVAVSGGTTGLTTSGGPITSSGTITLAGTLAVANGGTGVTTSTGTGSVVLNTSPSLVTPALGVPTSGVATNLTGLPLTTGVTGTLPVGNGGTGVTSSTGTGSNVLNTSPTLVTPVLGTPASGVATNLTGLPLTTGVTGTLPIANGGTANVTAAAAFAALAPLTTAGDIIIENASPAPARLAIGSTGNVLTVSGGLPAWSPPATSGTVTSVAVSGGTTGLTTSGGPITGSGTITLAGTLAVANGGTGVTTSTGTGNVVLSTSPTLVTPVLGTPTSGVATNLTGLPLTTGVTGILPVANGGTNVSSVTVAPAATAFAGWDANKNLFANSFISGYTTTATAAGTTTLVVGSTFQQFFTGSTTQTVVLPVTSTLVLGQQYQIFNNSTGAVTVQSSGANTIQVMSQNTIATLTCILTSGTTAASWNAQYAGIPGTTTGTAVPAGTVGAIIPNTITSNVYVGTPFQGAVTVTANTFVDDAGTLTLTPGLWEIMGNPSLASVDTSGQSVVQIALRTGSTTIKTYDYTPFVSAGTVSVGTVMFSVVVQPTASTTYKLSVQANQAAAAGTGAIKADGFTSGPYTFNSYWYAKLIG